MSSRAPDLWNFSNGALSRGPGGPGGPGGGGGSCGVTRSGSYGGGASAAGTELPRIRSPYNTAAAGGGGGGGGGGSLSGLAPTTLAPEEARLLYGASAVPGLGDDDLA